MHAPGFIDLLFILLLATLGLLCESVRLGTLDGDPARPGGGAVTRLAADDIALVTVADDHLRYDGQSFPTAADLPTAAAPGPGRTLVLVPDANDTSHHRVVETWGALAERGWSAKLGVRP